ncbi:Cytochrome c oxidase assembly protein CtaG/Cox11 [Dillenia turbinata]|uniref:Cytochrome c oxidase assembly protein CtaG/Cox11 n=1 Tax=Dillenia turbinata TaxID=194707 RepID=A0AAN8ZTF2_9MAGN
MSWSNLFRRTLTSFNQPLETCYSRNYYGVAAGVVNQQQWGTRKLVSGFLPIHTYCFKHQYSTRAAASATARERNSTKTLLYLSGLAAVMVGCTYAAVPLYRRFCQATGYGGTVQRRETVEEKIARHAQDGKVKVKPGESALAFYTAENCSSAPITGVSTYNVTPMKMMALEQTGEAKLVIRSFTEKLNAAFYFNKIQCFCFEEQRLLPGEQIDMPVFFYIDPEFETDPKMDGINNIILSYTFFKISEK